jgi:hypothetical protein
VTRRLRASLAAHFQPFPTNEEFAAAKTAQRAYVEQARAKYPQLAKWADSKKEGYDYEPFPLPANAAECDELFEATELRDGAIAAKRRNRARRDATERAAAHIDQLIPTLPGARVYFQKRNRRVEALALTRSGEVVPVVARGASYCTADDGNDIETDDDDNVN